MQTPKIPVEELLKQHNEMDSEEECDEKKKKEHTFTNKKHGTFLRKRKHLSSLILNDIKDEDVMKDNSATLISISLDDIKEHIPIENDEHLDLLDLISSYPPYKEGDNEVQIATTNRQENIPVNKKSISSTIISTFILTIVVVIIICVLGYFLYSNSSRDSMKRTSLYWGVGILVLFLMIFAVILYAKVKS